MGGGSDVVAHIRREDMKYRILAIAFAFLPVVWADAAELELPPEGMDRGNGISLLPESRNQAKRKPAADPLADFKDSDVFISIEGGDSLTWGCIREWIQGTVDRVSDRADMMDEGSAALRNMVIQKEVSKNVRSFLRYALIAKEARRLGITNNFAKIAKVREEWFEQYRNSGAAGAAKLKAAVQPDSFFEHALTNSVLWQSYADEVVLPKLEITDEEVSQRIKLQEKKIADAVATNSYKRAEIYKILKSVKYAPEADRISFSKAAEQWTEDYNGDIGGVFADDNDQPRDLVSGDVIKQVEDAYSKLQPGEISDVVETPYSWHVVKLLNRNFDEDGVEESANVAHIMLEKVPLPPVLTEEQVRHKLSNAKLRLAMEEKYLELLKSEKINCMLPLFDKEDRSVKRLRKQIKKEK